MFQLFNFSMVGGDGVPLLADLNDLSRRWGHFLAYESKKLLTLLPSPVAATNAFATVFRSKTQIALPEK